MEQVEDTLAFLLRSENRRDVLAALRDSRTLDRCELVDQVDASRRTVSRVLKTLEEEGYIRNTDNSYRLTSYGGFMINLYQDWKDRTALTDRHSPFLAHVDEEVLDCRLRWFRDAEITIAAEFKPNAPVNRLIELRRDATRIRSVTPFVERQCLTHVSERLRRGAEFELTVVVSEEMARTALSGSRYDDMIDTVREAESASIFIHPGLPELVVSLVDDVTALGAYADGRLHALVESDDPELRAWATDRIDGHRREATPLDEYPQ